jgi:hypothetical protein
MTTRNRMGGAQGKTRGAISASAALLVSLVVLSAVLLVSPAAASISSEPGVKSPATISKSDRKCVKCHSRKREKTLEDGDVLSLHVPKAEYANSVHGEIGCTSCHEALANKKHPSREPIASRREHSLALNQSCRNCHAENFEQYEHSIHASLVAEGSLSAPVCTDCHSAHAVESMAVYQPVTGLPCKNCHENIFDAYAQSVHGGARVNGNVIRDSHIQAPICADCHQAHGVTAVAASDYLQTTCLDCHQGASLAHKEWLPNAGLHLDVISCAVCHAPMAERRVNLELYDNITQLPVGQDESNTMYEERLHAADEAGDGMDPAELWKLVRANGRDGQATDVTLRGRMEVSTGPEAHRLSVKGSAVRNCDSCHQTGSDAFENVTVSISRPDGRKVRYKADKDILSSMTSVDSIGEFYVLGGTRIKLLDVLVVLSLIGGLAIPAGHIALGRVLKKKTQEGDQ